MLTPEPNPKTKPVASDLPFDPDDLGDLRNPKRQSPLLQNRLLHEAFLKAAFTRRLRPDDGPEPEQRALVCSPARMTKEDLEGFRVLSQVIRGSMSTQLAERGISANDEGIEIRFLHRCVNVAQSGRELHMYVEVRRGNEGYVLPSKRCVEFFSAGPVALHMHGLSEPVPSSFIMRPLVSKGAFEETVQSLVANFNNHRPVEAQNNWAIHWVMQAISRHKPLLEATASLDSEPPERAGGSQNSGSAITVEVLSSCEVDVHLRVTDMFATAGLRYSEADQQPMVALSVARRRP